jgi:hypothetical protein
MASPEVKEVIRACGDFSTQMLEKQRPTGIMPGQPLAVKHVREFLSRK